MGSNFFDGFLRFGQAKQPLQTLLAYHTDGSRVHLRDPFGTANKRKLFLDLSKAEKAYLYSLDTDTENVGSSDVFRRKHVRRFLDPSVENFYEFTI